MTVSAWTDITVFPDGGTASPDLIINPNIHILWAMNAGLLTHDMASDANYQLSDTADAKGVKEWHYGNIEVTDTGVVLTTTRNIIFPDGVQLKFTAINNTAQSLVFITSSGTGVTVATLKSAILRGDGTDIIRVTADT